MEKDKIKIYLIGFPKSGTSWLIRLMAHVLQIPIKDQIIGEELSTEINDRLDLKSATSFIAKIHHSPDFFFKEIDQYPERVIYIYRDIRAVIISAFFYFKVPQRYSFLFRLEKDHSKPVFYEILRRLFFPFARIMLSRQVKKFGEFGLGGKIGAYKEHRKSWHSVANSSHYRSTPYAFISYEELYENPCSEIEKILNTLELPIPSKKWINQAIQDESFAKMKSRLKSSTNPVEHSILRTGQKEDWRYYLTEKNLSDLKQDNI